MTNFLIRHTKYLETTAELFVACRENGAPLDLRAYNEACGIKREVRLENLLGDGQLRWLPAQGQYEIVINCRLPRRVRRFVWAHEIAHTIVNREETERKSRAPSVERVAENASSRNHAEILCDQIANELLVPEGMLSSCVGNLRPSLATVRRVSRWFDVTLTTAAIRFMRSLSAKCWLIFWDVRTETNGLCRLKPYMVFKTEAANWRDSIGDIVDLSAQPFVAHQTGSPQAGRWRVDLGRGIDDYYVESAPSRIRKRATVMSIVVFEGVAKDSAQWTLFGGETKTI